MTADLLGWTATAVFVSSYAFRRAETLRRVQMLGAALWMAYGVVMGALPVIVANVLVLGAAVWASRRGPSDAGAAGAPVAPALPRPGEGGSPRPGAGVPDWSGARPLSLQATAMKLRERAEPAPSLF